MLFRRSIDTDYYAKHVVTEELAWLQVSYYYEERRRGAVGFMGFPWMLNLVKSYLRLHGLKARTEVVSSLVHAADLIARDVIARHQRYCEAVSDSRVPDEFVAFSRLIELLARRSRPVGEFTFDRARDLAAMSELHAGLNELHARAKALGSTDADLETAENRFEASAERLSTVMQLRVIAMIGERPQQYQLEEVD